MASAVFGEAYVVACRLQNHGPTRGIVHCTPFAVLCTHVATSLPSCLRGPCRRWSTVPARSTPPLEHRACEVRAVAEATPPSPGGGSSRRFKAAEYLAFLCEPRLFAFVVPSGNFVKYPLVLIPLTNNACAENPPCTIKSFPSSTASLSSVQYTTV